MCDCRSLTAGIWCRRSPAYFLWTIGNNFPQTSILTIQISATTGRAFSLAAQTRLQVYLYIYMLCARVSIALLSPRIQSYIVLRNFAHAIGKVLYSYTYTVMKSHVVLAGPCERHAMHLPLVFISHSKTIV